MGYLSDFLTGGTPSSDGGYQTPDKGFDNDNATYYQNYNSVPCWCKYDLGVGVSKIAAQYTITASTYSPSYVPTAWVFEGSNDDSNWTTLDTRSGVSWSSQFEKKTFEFENSTAYRYYRWNFSAQSVAICIAEFEAMEMDGQLAANFLCSRERDRFRSKGISLGLKVPSDGNTSLLTMRHNRFNVVGVSCENAKTYTTVWDSPTMTAANAPSPYVVSASYDQNSNNGVYAWDRQSNTYWGTSGGGTGPQWTKIDCGAVAPMVTGLTVRGYAGYGPKNIILQGSNNDSVWDDLFSTTLNDSGDTQSFSFPGKGAYRYYRLYCTDSYVPGNQATYEITLSGIR